MISAAIMLVKDEADIIESVVRHTAGQVDAVIVSDNGSTDGTREILEGMIGNGVYTLVDDPEIGYYQSRKMSALAARAGGLGAEWIVPVDADELWAARTGRLGDFLAGLPDMVLVAQAVLFDHIATGRDSAALDPIERLGYRTVAPLPLRKVAARYRPGMVFEPGNHSATYPEVDAAPAVLDELVIRHFPYRSPDQFISKVKNGAAAYAATDLPVDTGAHKRFFGMVYEKRGEDGLRELFTKRFYVAKPKQDDNLIFDPCR